MDAPTIHSADKWEALENGGLLLRVWSPSRLVVYQRCPRMFYLQEIEGWRRSTSNENLVFGTAVHEAIRAYYDCNGHGQERLRAAIREALSLIEPLSDDPKVKKNRANVIRAVIAWHDDYGIDSEGWVELEPSAGIANEIPYRIDLMLETPNGNSYEMGGILDRVLRWKGKPSFLDAKTTGYAMGTFWFHRFKSDTQMACYTIAAHAVLPGVSKVFLIDGFFVGVEKVTVCRGEIDMVDVDDALEEVSYWIKQAENNALSGYWPRNRNACNDFGGCSFRDVCCAPRRKQQLFLEQSHIKTVDSTALADYVDEPV